MPEAYLEFSQTLVNYFALDVWVGFEYVCACDKNLCRVK